MLVSAFEAHSTVRCVVSTARSCPLDTTFQRLGALQNSYPRPSNPTQVLLVIFLMCSQCWVRSMCLTVFIPWESGSKVGDVLSEGHSEIWIWRRPHLPHHSSTTGKQIASHLL